MAGSRLTISLSIGLLDIVSEVENIITPVNSYLMIVIRDINEIPQLKVNISCVTSTCYWI